MKLNAFSQLIIRYPAPVFPHLAIGLLMLLVHPFPLSPLATGKLAPLALPPAPPKLDRGSWPCPDEPLVPPPDTMSALAKRVERDPDLPVVEGNGQGERGR